ERQRPVEHRGELDLLVAPQARVGRAAGRVLGHEVLDHVALETFGHVPDVERDADDVGRPPGVARVLDRAAAPGPGAVGLGVRGQGQMDTSDVVTGLGDPGGGHGGVDAARHGGKHTQSHDRSRVLSARACTGARSGRTVCQDSSMRLFGRKSQDEGAGPGERVAGFWQWWESARPELDAAVAAGESGKMAELLGPAVAEIHADLVWELAPG